MRTIMLRLGLFSLVLSSKINIFQYLTHKLSKFGIQKLKLLQNLYRFRKTCEISYISLPHKWSKFVRKCNKIYIVSDSIVEFRT